MSLLERTLFTATSEMRLQDGIAQVLETAYPGEFEREFILNPRDRPDFMRPADGTLIEVKWGTSGGALTAVARQLLRYAEDERVQRIIFATPQRRIVAALPAEVRGRVPIFGVVLKTGY